MEPDVTTKLFRETDSLVSYFIQRVTHHKSLDEANEFCRYLVWSPILPLLKAHAATSAVAIDVPKLEKRITKLHESVREQFKGMPSKAVK